MSKTNLDFSPPKGIDPRIKLLLSIILGSIIFQTSSRFFYFWAYAIVIALWLVIREWKTAIKLVVFLVVLVKVEDALLMMGNENAQVYLHLLLFVFQRPAIFYIMGSWMTTKMNLGVFLVGLQKMRVPNGLIISLAVMFRYGITVTDEIQSIRDTMKLRGIDLNILNVLTNPVRSLEYTMVPLAIRSLTIADQLAASAMTRGLDTDRDRTSYLDVKIRSKDIMALASVLTALLIGVYLRDNVAMWGIL